MATNVIDAINAMENGKTLTVAKDSSGNKIAHKVTLGADLVSTEKQDLDYTKGESLTNFDLVSYISNNSSIKSVADMGFTQFKGNSSSTICLLSATSIGQGAFYSCSDCEKIKLPNVTSIGIMAFDACTSLTSIELNSMTVEQVIENLPNWGSLNHGCVITCSDGTYTVH